MSEKEKDTVVTPEVTPEAAPETTPEASQEASPEISSSSLFDKRRGLLEEFEFDTLRPNTSGSTVIPLSTTPVIIAELTGDDALSVDDECDRVWLTCTVGWQAITNAPNTNKVDVLFRILRGTRHNHDHEIGNVIFSCRESANAAEENFRTTTFTHVDLPLADLHEDHCEDDHHHGCHKEPVVPYIVTAELPLGGAANVIGPITFTGAEIEGNF